MKNIIGLLTNDVTAEIFSYVGARGTVRCSMVCKEWHALSCDNPTLWQFFVQNEFCIHLSSSSFDVNSGGSDEEKTNQKNNKRIDLIFTYLEIFN